MLTRREVLLVPVAVAAARAAYAQNAEPGKMLLSIHQNTSRAAGFQGSLEGWARAGIRYVELNDGLLQTFLESNSLAAAGRVLTDNGLTPVCGVIGGAYFDQPVAHIVDRIAFIADLADFFLGPVFRRVRHGMTAIAIGHHF
mgnify:CR=1 FL=1